MPVQPYLFFEGRCEEAAEFYQGALDAQVVMSMRFKDAPPPEPGAAEANPGCGPTADMAEKIMHMALQVGDTTILASDGRCSGQPKFEGFGLAITVDDEATCRRRFNALAEGGNVMMPLARTFYSPLFGMTHDKFGVLWMIMVKGD